MCNTFTFPVIFVITLLAVLTVCNGEVIKDSWVKPDAFSRNKSPTAKQTITSSQAASQTEYNGECDCPVCPEEFNTESEPEICMKVGDDDDIATVLYKRLVSSMILKNYSPSKSSTKILKLSVTEKHLKILESSPNIRDWDDVMSEIIASIEHIDPVTNYIYKEESRFSFSSLNLSFVATFLSQTEVKFTLLVILFFSFGVFLHKRFRWGFFWIFGMALFVSGYFYTYYECNRQLEVDEIVNMMVTQRNPREEIEKPTSYLGSFYRIFSNPEAECEKYLR